jgi:hypothetical protein
MKNILLFLFFLSSYHRLKASNILYQMSVESVCSLVLLAMNLYSCFGHSAIRIQDKKYDIDLVFNYGTFDFNKPNFYVNFLKGILIYSLGVDDYESFKSNYIYEERGIAEQVLRLDSIQKLRLVNFLMNNASSRK